MNEIVVWARQWPSAQVREINLLPGDGKSAENRTRRNRFYEQFGIEFDYLEADMVTGVSRPINAGQLNEVTIWNETITEHSAITYLRKLSGDADDAAMDARGQTRYVADLNRQLDFAERHPIKWLLKRLFTDDPAKTLLAIAVAVVVGTALYRVL